MAFSTTILLCLLSGPLLLIAQFPIVMAFQSTLGKSRSLHRITIESDGALSLKKFTTLTSPLVTAARSSPTATELSCGFIDTLRTMFQGSEISTVNASHILINGGPESASKLNSIKSEIGDDPIRFGEAAARYSDCASASKGGDLGEFGRGTMVKEFENIVFDPKTPIGIVQGPIQTEFGYHLILIRERT